MAGTSDTRNRSHTHPQLKARSAGWEARCFPARPPTSRKPAPALGGALIVYDQMIDDGLRENAAVLLLSLGMLIRT
jgi:hypothetical protein